MKAKTSILAVSFMFVSSLSFAGAMHHPHTGDVIFDTENAEISASCGDVVLSVDDTDQSISVVYNFFEVIGQGNLICQIKMNFSAPQGYRMNVSTSAAVSGGYSGPSMASLEHTLAGTTVYPSFAYFNGIDPVEDAYVLSQELNEIGSSDCGAGVTVKTIVSITGLTPSSWINVNNGSIESDVTMMDQGHHVGYHIDWSSCTVDSSELLVSHR